MELFTVDENFDTLHDMLRDAVVYMKKRRQEALGKIPSMQVDGSQYAGGNVDLAHIEADLKRYQRLLLEFQLDNSL